MVSKILKTASAYCDICMAGLLIESMLIQRQYTQTSHKVLRDFYISKPNLDCLEFYIAQVEHVYVEPTITMLNCATISTSITNANHVFANLSTLWNLNLHMCKNPWNPSQYQGLFIVCTKAYHTHFAYYETVKNVISLSKW